MKIQVTRKDFLKKELFQNLIILAILMFFFLFALVYQIKNPTQFADYLVKFTAFSVCIGLWKNLRTLFSIYQENRSYF